MCENAYLSIKKPQKLPEPLSGPWIPATDCSLRSSDFASLCRQISASEAGAPPLTKSWIRTWIHNIIVTNSIIDFKFSVRAFETVRHNNLVSFHVFVTKFGKFYQFPSFFALLHHLWAARALSRQFEPNYRDIGIVHDKSSCNWLKARVSFLTLSSIAFLLSAVSLNNSLISSSTSVT